MQVIRELLQYQALQIVQLLPSFSKSSDRLVRRVMVQKAGIAAIWVSVLALGVVLPLWNYLSLTRWFFKLRHYARHDLLRKRRWFHRSRFYHNQAFKICTFWVIVSLLCSLVSSGGDLIQITKRLGRVAVALMPPLLFLTLRPSPLPYTLYLSLLPIHKWISRVVVLLSALHTLLYSWYFIQSRSFINKVTKLANIWGVVALFLFVLIAITSVSQVRRHNFRLFYYTHYLATWLTVILIHYHARPPVSYYTAMNCIILIAQVAYRIFHTTRIRATVVHVSPSLLLIDFPMSDLSSKPIMPSSHIRMAAYYRHSPLKRIFQQLIPLQHPYTIASLPNDESVKLIVRCGNFEIRNNSEYLVTGAFEPKIDFLSKSRKRASAIEPFSFQNQSPVLLASPLHYNIDARRALIVTGGSAISFGLPLLRILNFNGVTVRVKWVTRDYRDLKLLKYFKNNFEGLEIYVTDPKTEEQDLRIDYVDFDDEAPSASNSSEMGSGTAGNTTNDSGDNYGTFKSTDTSLLPTLKSHGRSNQEDEIDFTQMFSARSAKTKLSKVAQEIPIPFNKESTFRKPSILTPPSDIENFDLGESSQKNLKIPAGVQVFLGRPKLTHHDYQWCLEKECIGPSDTNDCSQSGATRAHVDDLSRVWVIAAGPLQLVESTKRWATDGGLHFHEESFTF
ncbi:LANO_0F15874g1_1 [Lachancea nothofagi CBS 11611]|uniref:LANO_0F15874g1_1 n=1 Tax=Lachancea nothofagi CBS 11611 TaxID=1266666 RepID=A0A1G4KD20_9SACH|nr:LANO_0F15874g1_1 [Lachancea nothofagi CBS 11611]